MDAEQLDTISPGLPCNLHCSGNNTAIHCSGSNTNTVPKWREKMKQVYGDELLVSDGGEYDGEWYARWKQLVSSFGSLYDLPNGSVGKQFVDMLADEVVNMLVECSVTSERLIVFCRSVLQKDRAIRKSYDIRRLILRRLEIWRKGGVDELVQEAIRCSRQFNAGMSSNKV